jgi:hypothetical protein
MNITIYLNKRNSELIAQEPNKGGLINKLLTAYFTGKDRPKIPDYKQEYPTNVEIDDTPPEKLKRLATPNTDTVQTPDFLPTIGPRIKDGDTPFRTDDEWVEAEGLEKPCCKKAKPCQHWEYNGDTQIWQNSLSGRQREVV